MFRINKKIAYRCQTTTRQEVNYNLSIDVYILIES
jgi:hypothetical protein